MAAIIAVAVLNPTDSSDPLTGWVGLKYRINLLVDNGDPVV